MKIAIKKGKHKVDTLCCTRADGSTTWAEIQKGFGAEHDLTHYAIETVLGYQHAFYGLLEQGHNIQDFEQARAKGNTELVFENLPPEAVITEYMVGLVYMEIGQGELADFNGQLNQIFEQHGLEWRVDFRTTSLMLSAPNNAR